MKKEEITEQQVVKWIEDNKEQMIADIVRLVNIRSVAEEEGTNTSKGCLDALNEMLTIAEGYGFHTHNYENYVGCVSTDLNTNKKSIGLWSHLDVVPEGNDWDFPPYRATVIDDWIIGRGAQDNKGPAVAALYTLRFFKDHDVDLPFQLKLYLGTNEESGMSDLDYYTAHYPQPDFSVIPDCGFPVCYGEKGMIGARLIAGEPFKGAVTTLQGGTAKNMVADSAVFSMEHNGVTVQYSAKGASKHSAFPYGAEDAIHKLVQALQASPQLNAHDQSMIEFISNVTSDFDGTFLGIACEDEISGKLTCVGSLLGLEEGIPWVNLNIRFPIQAKGKEIVEKIKGICEGNGFIFECNQISEPSYFSKEHPIVKSLTDTFQRLTGSTKEAYTMGGGTYARKLSNAVGFGMGLPQKRNLPEMIKQGHGGAHEPDEAQDVLNLMESLKIYILAMIDICNIFEQQ